jgi:hypothetical protein
MNALPTRVVRSITRESHRTHFVRARLTGRNMLAGRGNAQRNAIAASLAGF